MFSPSQMSALSVEFDRLNEGSRQVERIDTHAICESPVIRTLMYNNPTMYSLIDACFGSDEWYMVLSESFKMKRVSGWHRDFASRLTHIKLNVYLEDCSAGGGLVIVPGTQRVDDDYSTMLSTHLNWPGGEGLDLATVPHVDTKCVPGTVTVFNCNCIHAASSNPRHTMRRCFSFVFVAKPDNVIWREKLNRYFASFKLHTFIKEGVVPAGRHKHYLYSITDVNWADMQVDTDGRWLTYTRQLEDTRKKMNYKEHGKYNTSQETSSDRTTIDGI
jgi:hypothetical protein